MISGYNEAVEGKGAFDFNGLNNEGLNPATSLISMLDSSALAFCIDKNSGDKMGIGPKLYTTRDARDDRAGRFTEPRKYAKQAPRPGEPGCFRLIMGEKSETEIIPLMGGMTTQIKHCFFNPPEAFVKLLLAEILAWGLGFGFLNMPTANNQTREEYVKMTVAMLPVIVNKLVTLESYKTAVGEQIRDIYDVVANAIKKKEIEQIVKRKELYDLKNAGRLSEGERSDDAREE